MAKFWEFLTAVFSHWEPVMSGVVVALFLWALGWLYEQRNGSGMLPWYVYIFVAFMFLFYACYRAWLEKDTLLTEVPQFDIQVYGIPLGLAVDRRLLLFIPEVTITNSSFSKTASIGVELHVPIGGHGSAVFPPESTPVKAWEQSTQSARNQCLIFPLNLSPGHAAGGYIAFGADRLKGAAHTPDYKNCEVQFKNLHTGQTIHTHPLRFIVTI